MGGDKVPDEEQDVHDDVFCDRDDVRASDLENLKALRGGGVEVDVIRSDTSRDTDLEILGLQNMRSQKYPSSDDHTHITYLVKKLLSEVTRMKRSSDHDVGL